MEVVELSANVTGAVVAAFSLTEPLVPTESTVKLTDGVALSPCAIWTVPCDEVQPVTPVHVPVSVKVTGPGVLALVFCTVKPALPLLACCPMVCGAGGVTATVYEAVGVRFEVPRPENEVGEVAAAVNATAPVVPTKLTLNGTVCQELMDPSATLTVPNEVLQDATPVQAALRLNVTAAPLVLVLLFCSRNVVLLDVVRAASVLLGSCTCTATMYAGVAV